jgi:Na+/H+ antiporter NhaD/arsenite permease-like protein
MLTKELATGLVALVTFVALAIGGVPFARLNRATIAVVGSAVLLALGVVTLTQAGSTVDPSTILLLFSMMVINAVLELAGFFNWAGQLIIERAGSPRVLLILVVVTGGVLSALFLNDPVVLMLTPLVCGVTLRLKRNPVPYLIALATASNVGSTATITGNPQNILIGTSSGIPYLSFLAHLGPVAVVGLVIVIAVIRLLYPDEFRTHGLELRDPPPELIPAPTPSHAVMSMASAASMVYAPVLRKSLIVIALLFVAFLAGVQVPLAAFLAACALLITRRIKSQKILMLVDWPLLVMFSGLFVVTGALEITGVSQAMFGLVKGLAYAGVLPLSLVTTVLSNVISNVPAVLLFRPLIPKFPNPAQAWLTLSASSTLAGNLTLVGSVANLIVAEQALKVGVRLGFKEFLCAGVLITALTLVVAVVWLQIVT